MRCANHPDRETMLRCNRCGKPICVACAVRTPVGQRCRECVREQQAVYYNGGTADLLVAVAVGALSGAVLGALAFVLFGLLGFFRLIGALFAGPALGGVAAEAVRRSLRRRRPRHLRQATAIAVGVGVLSGVLVLVLGGRVLSPIAVVLSLPLFIGRFEMLILAVLAASTVYARLT